MSKYSNFAFSVVNRYISEFLEQEEIMDKTITISNNNIQPTLIPGGQTPEVMDAILDGPQRAPAFITYELDLDEHKQTPWSQCERMRYEIFAPTASKVLEVMNAIRDLFAHEDISAKRTNEFGHSINKDYFQFTDMYYQVVGGPVPIKSDGGRYGAVVNVHYDYICPLDQNGLRA